MKHKRIFSSIILLFLAWGLTNVVIGLVTSNPKVDIVVDNDRIYYEVNEQGNLTIQLRGTMIGVKSSDCEFQLKIPENFEISTLEDGSPIIELVNEGSSMETTHSGDEFHSVFVLETYASTLLPLNYTLEINSPKKTYTMTVTPQWKQYSSQSGLTGGTGAKIVGIFPYITSFWAYDSYKGSSVQARTYIYNPSIFYEHTVEELKYTISAKAGTYADWSEQQTPPYSEYGWIDPRRTYVAVDYLSSVYTAHTNKKYAFNIGTYNVDSVYASGYGMRGHWSSTYTPSSSQGEFNINVGTNHKVFCVILQDPAFAQSYGYIQEWDGSDQSNGYGVVDWIYQPWSSCDWRFNADFEIDLVITIVDSYYFQNSNVDLAIEEGKTHAHSLLGLMTHWYDTGGTSHLNHGFDFLILLLPGDGPESTCAKNNVIAIENWADGTTDKDEMFHIFQHEVGHIFQAEDLDDLGGYPDDYVSVMGVHQWRIWASHVFVSENYQIIGNHRTIFDGA